MQTRTLSYNGPCRPTKSPMGQAHLSPDGHDCCQITEHGFTWLFDPAVCAFPLVRFAKRIGSIYKNTQSQDNFYSFFYFIKVFFKKTKTKTGSHHVSVIGLEPVIQTRLSSQSQSSTCLCLSRAGFRGTQHRVWSVSLI